MSSYQRSSYYADRVNEILNTSPVDPQTILMNIAHKKHTNKMMSPATHIKSPPKSILKTGDCSLYKQAKRVTIYCAAENTET